MFFGILTKEKRPGPGISFFTALFPETAFESSAHACVCFRFRFKRFDFIYFNWNVVDLSITILACPSTINLQRDKHRNNFWVFFMFCFHLCSNTSIFICFKFPECEKCLWEIFFCYLTLERLCFLAPGNKEYPRI